MIQKVADTIRGLAADMVEKAKSGHPGMPLGSADIAAVLYSEILKHDPESPEWVNRDRFVLSAGHGSALLYSILHLTGYPVLMEDLKKFRQLGSITAGHPEHWLIPGIETTTGPLGQGVGNAVGMALAERMLAARFNRPGFEIIDHYTYVLAGDGCQMEGVTSEAVSLAGDLGLGKLIMIYDDNEISIEGSTDLAFKENVAERYSAYGWQVIKIDGNDPVQIRKALSEAKAETQQPSIIIAKTIIGKGSPLEGSAKTHGEPLGAENITALKKALGLPETDFYVPEEVYDYFQDKRQEWHNNSQLWQELFNKWGQAFPELRQEWEQDRGKISPENFQTLLPVFEPGSKLATREAGGQVLNTLAAKITALVGGSADLAPSTKTHIKDAGDIKRGDFQGRNLHFGVREHAMGAIMNGISVYGGFRIYGSTFLVFSDYMRPPIRLAALMEQPVIYIFTHDSFWVGEDGPTHEPIEQIEALRAILGLQVIRPADANETTWAWLAALERVDGPTALILTRQKLPVLNGTSVEGFSRGGYIIREAAGNQPDAVVMATGSEVSLAIEAVEILAKENLKIRVISVPCREKLLSQEQSYLQLILGNQSPRIAVEAGIGVGWYQLTGTAGLVISLEHFGASGKAEDLAKEFGFTPEAVAAKIKGFLKNKKK